MTTLPLSRRDGIALWRKVEAALAEEIGRMPGDAERRLPTERELAERFGVNRHTVRQAIRALTERGLVRTEQGRGMFAADILVDYELGPRTRFSANLTAQDRAPGRRHLGGQILPADERLAALLGVPVGAPLAVMESLGLADEVPICVGALHLSAMRFPGVLERLGESADITGVLASYGVSDYRRRSTRVQARLPSEQEAARLRQPAIEPVLVTEALDVDPAGRPVSWSITVWASARVQLTVGT